MTGAMDMPAHLTTLRGKGGFGAGSQKMMDVFWLMRSSKASAPSIQTLMHFYIGIATTITDANMNVELSFPL